jgi:hypothetical protein
MSPRCWSSGFRSRKMWSWGCGCRHDRSRLVGQGRWRSWRSGGRGCLRHGHMCRLGWSQFLGRRSWQLGWSEVLGFPRQFGESHRRQNRLLDQRSLLPWCREAREYPRRECLLWLCRGRLRCVWKCCRGRVPCSSEGHP